MNKYGAIYVKGSKVKETEVEAETSYEAQVKAARLMGVKCRGDVDIWLIAKDGVPVVHDGSELPGA